MERKKIVCGECGYFIAVIDRGREITIKYKDLYIYFEGGILREVCPKCGRQNFICDEKYRKENMEKIDNLKLSNHIIESKYVEWLSSREYHNKNKGE